MEIVDVLFRSNHRRCSVKEDVLKNFAIFTGKHLCFGVFFNILQAWRPATLLKETPTQVLSCEYCKLFKSTYFEEHLRTGAPEFMKIYSITVLLHDKNSITFFFATTNNLLNIHSQNLFPPLRWLAWLIWNWFLLTNFSIIW